MAHRNPYRLAQYPSSRSGNNDGWGIILFIIVLICALIRDFLETTWGMVCCISSIIILIIWYAQSRTPLIKD
jgi:hypothetical protein